jgi:hypothetical protein
MRLAVFALLFSAAAALAQDNVSALNFDIAKLCAWQNKNNNMAIAECTALETDAQKTVAERETAADAKRKEECLAETKNYSGDSGFASYTVYAGCLKDGPGSL